jgi:hypothetical protein
MHQSGLLAFSRRLLNQQMGRFGHSVEVGGDLSHNRIV